uniref:Putative secreted protein n=1 Tax=Panstrongylus lignarius TaxID=156445 RepID=A0A224XTG6_9HEMI
MFSWFTRTLLIWFDFRVRIRGYLRTGSLFLIKGFFNTERFMSVSIKFVGKNIFTCFTRVINIAITKSHMSLKIFF